MRANTIPFRRRKIDWVIVLFFLINLFFITYIVDIEQLIIPDPYHFVQPLWPPAPLIRMVHAYGTAYDPLLMARPQWWKDTIWLDVVLYGPYYLVAVYAFVRGREWIRVPTIFYAGMLFADVFIILGEELAGAHASPQPLLVVSLNLPWLLIPILLILRMWREHPFTSTEAAAQIP
jgi:hypothetical protein